MSSIEERLNKIEKDIDKIGKDIDSIKKIFDVANLSCSPLYPFNFMDRVAEHYARLKLNDDETLLAIQESQNRRNISWG